MPATSLALPGVLFVGEDERARLVAHLGPAAGWMIPKGVLQWSHEVSVVSRDQLSEDVRRDAKIVMPEEQIAPARMPLSHQAALKSPLVGISTKLTQKLVDSGIRVHTIGADRVTSSFYYIAEGGGEPNLRVEGDLVAAVGAMLGERADNAAIERVLDGIVDRLLRSLSKDRVAEISLELAAALPRAAADGTGMEDIDLEAFEKELQSLVGTSEKYKGFLQEIASKIGDTNERKVDIPLFVDARKVSQGPFELTVGEQKVALVTHERWLATGPFTEPTRSPAPAPVVAKAPDPKPAVATAAPTPVERQPTPQPMPQVSPANIKPLAAPIAPTTTSPPRAEPPRPVSSPPQAEPAPAPTPIAAAPEPAPAQPAAAVVAPVPAPVVEAKPVQTITERPKPAPTPAPEPKIPQAAPLPTPTPLPVVAHTPTPSPVVHQHVAQQHPQQQPSPMVKQQPNPNAIGEANAHARDARNATTQKIKRKEGGFPWLLLLVLAAALFAGYRFWWMRRQ